MRIGLDIQATQGPQTGLGVATRELVLALAEENRRHELVPIFREVQGPWTTSQRLFWENVNLPRQVRGKGVDLCHTMAFAPPLKKSLPWIVTVHDLISLRYDTRLGPGAGFYWKWWLPRAIRSAHRWIADSECTKRDLLELVGVPQERVRVIPLAPSPSFRILEDPEFLKAAQERHDIRKPYVLFVGTLEPRKNLPTVIRSFARLKRKVALPHVLVLVGMPGWDVNHIRHIMEKEGCERDVIMTGYVDSADLVALYNTADCFVFPSFYEGFGLPPLEAMACGTAVVASNVSSLPEICGDAAHYVDPSSVEDLTLAMERILTDETYRFLLIQRGRNQIKKFCWTDTARQVLSVYDECS